MKCKKCGADQWYRRGKYKRCIPCHNKNQLKSYHNRKLGIERGRQSKYRPRPLSKTMTSQPIVQTVCSRGHELSGDNVRLDLDSTGNFHRRCKKCEYLASRKKYGLPVNSDMVKLLAPNEWERIEGS
jgi:hypothetical protein